MDLVIDPIDLSGNVPEQAFGFIAGYDSTIPIQQIRDCAEHFIPQAQADFARIISVMDFCNYFLERSRLHYRRFLYTTSTRHGLCAHINGQTR